MTPTGPRLLAEIRDSGVLRACYASGNYPLTFFNSDGELVGFDIEMAHRFAKRLDVSLEFVHVRSQQDLLGGYCDVFFNSLALNPDRADFSASTAPFNQITVAFVVPHQRRDRFVTWDAIKAQGEITVAASAFQSVPPEVGRRIPQADIVRQWSYEEQRRFFESNGEGAVAMIDSAEEGAAWTVLYPLFAVIVPRPVIRLPIVYQVAPDSPGLLRAMNDWLALEKAIGGIDEIYDYWVEGKTEQVDPPRWSVIRDVLGWVD